MRLIVFNQLRPEKGIVYSRDHLRRKCAAGEFPKPIALSDRRIVRELVIADAKPGLHKVYDQHAYRGEKRHCLEL